MSSTPETVAQDAPRYTPDKLNSDPVLRQQVVDDVGDLSTMSAQDCEGALQRALDAGLVKREGADQSDDTFGGTRLLATVEQPEVLTFLSDLKDRKANMLRDEQLASWRAELAPPVQKAERMARVGQIVNRLYANDELSLTAYQKGTKKKGAAAPDPDTDATLIIDDRRKRATKEALDLLLVDLKRTTDRSAERKFQGMLNNASEHGADIKRAETERRAKARTQDEAERRQRANDARTRINRDQDAAKAENTRQDLDTLRRTNWRAYSAHLRQERETHEIDPVTGALRGISRETRRELVNDAHDEALRDARREGSDGRIVAVDDVRQRYQELIDGTVDANMRSQLREAQKRAMEAEHSRHVAMDAERGSMLAGAMDLSNTAFAASREGRATKDRLSFTDPRAEEQVTMRRQQLGVEVNPFVEVKNGGFFHWDKKNRGPRVIERYYRSADPNNNNMVVLERRRRRGGELVSQTVFTTERPIRQRRGHELPPREVRAQVDQIRIQDSQGMRGDKSYLIRERPGDYIGVGRGEDAISTRYTAEAPRDPRAVPARPGGPVGPDPRYTREPSNRRGGFWYRWFRGRL